MKSYWQFIKESAGVNSSGAYNVPVISIEKTQVDLNEPETVNEINRNLSLTLERDFPNPSDGLNSAKKILTMYGIEIPDQKFDLTKGGFSVPISQFKSSGENFQTVSAPLKEPNEKHTFHFKYELKSGVFDVDAWVDKN